MTLKINWKNTIQIILRLMTNLFIRMIKIKVISLLLVWCMSFCLWSSNKSFYLQKIITSFRANRMRPLTVGCPERSGQMRNEVEFGTRRARTRRPDNFWLKIFDFRFLFPHFILEFNMEVLEKGFWLNLNYLCLSMH